MRRYRNKAVFKCHTALLLGPLERRLTLAKEKVRGNEEIEQIIDEISKEVRNGNDFVERISDWDSEVARWFQNIERSIDSLIHPKQREIQMFDDEKLAELLKYYIYYLQKMLKHPPKSRLEMEFGLGHVGTINEIGETSNTGSYQENEIYMDPKGTHNQFSPNKRENIPKGGAKPHEKASDLPQEAPITEVEKSSNRSYQENKIPMVLDILHSLDPKKKSCLYSLILFPEKTELKKRLVIYWWIGLGLIEPFTGDTSRTERCELFFANLVDKGVLIPKYKKHNKLAIDRCIIDPTIHKLLGDLIGPAIRAEGTGQSYDGDKMKVLLNLYQSYLISEEIIKYNQDLGVVQLGIWQCTERETEFNDRFEKKKSNSKITVDETDFLNKLGENVTYISLQGISGIEELHQSIGKLENLVILDLNACRHLEKLPQKPWSISKQKLIRWALPQASWFKKLMVLDLSGCYLLDHHMPIWICEIANLEVLKGFVVGSLGNKNRSCRLRDLSKLIKLRKLSIRIANRGTVDLSVLQPLDRLLVLTIIWEGNMRNKHISASSLPENIEKLDIRCYPQSEASELLNPEKLKNLKRLYIRGGKLTKIPCNGNWQVEILRLRFLRNLDCPTWEELSSSFKNLRYVECVECPKPRGFPTDRSSWSKESDVPFQRGNASETPNES